VLREDPAELVGKFGPLARVCLQAVEEVADGPMPSGQISQQPGFWVCEIDIDH
jgi:hypothetical protein